MLMSKRILVVVDEIRSRKHLCKFLREAGYEVSEAKDGREAFNLLDGSLLTWLC